MKLPMAFIFLWISMNLTDADLKDEDYAPQIQEVMGTWRKNCISTSGTTEQAITELRGGKFPDDPKLKQYVKCIYDQSGMFKQNGDLDIDYVNQIEPEKWKNRLSGTMSDCYQKTQSDMRRIDRIYKMTECLHGADPENFGFP